MVRAVNWIGDAVMTVPALKELRRLLPDARIDLVARPWVGGLFADAPYVDRVVSYDKKGGHGGLLGRWRFARRVLAPERYDAALLLQNAFEAAFVSFVARVPRRLGFPTDGRGPLLTRPRLRDRSAGLHHARRYLSLLTELGWSDVDYLAPDYHPDIRLALDADLPARGAATLAGHGVDAGALRGPLVGVNPGAAFGPAKRWPPERFGQLAARLATERDATVVLLGGPAEGELARSLVASATAAGAPPEALLDLVGQTSLDELLGLLARCDLVLANDSGPMHLAAALDRPLVALFGSTDDVATGPLTDRVTVLHERLDCSPCFERECPLGTLACFDAIEVDAVWDAAVALLDAPDRGTMG